MITQDHSPIKAWFWVQVWEKIATIKPAWSGAIESEIRCCWRIVISIQDHSSVRNLLVHLRSRFVWIEDSMTCREIRDMWTQNKIGISQSSSSYSSASENLGLVMIVTACSTTRPTMQRTHRMICQQWERTTPYSEWFSFAEYCGTELIACEFNWSVCLPVCLSAKL